MKSISAMFLLKLKHHYAALMTLICLVTWSMTAEAGNNTFSRMIVLGDSLSDTGNFYNLSGGVPPAPYFEGRFCNGPLWVEYLASGLRLTIEPGDNYAVGGATTGTFNSNNGVAGRTYPGLQQQVQSLLQDNSNQLDPEAIYIVWAGANDFFVTLATGGDPLLMIGNGVANTVAAVQTLWAAGARHIMVPNIPDLGVTPYALGSGSAPLVNQLCLAYNQVLSATLAQLRAAGISTIEVDAFTTLQNMVKYRRAFGFKNVTESYLPMMQGDVREYLFWDTVHPTTRAHTVLGAVAWLELFQHFVLHRSFAF